MARTFFRIFTENNPVMGYSKTFFIRSEAKGLTEMLIPMNKVKTNPSFCELFSIMFQRSKTFQRLFVLCYVNTIIMEHVSICKCVIISITVRATELYHIPN